jgi:hypothetical protein
MKQAKIITPSSSSFAQQRAPTLKNFGAEKNPQETQRQQRQISKHYHITNFDKKIIQYNKKIQKPHNFSIKSSAPKP